jgi:hypothetical protein
MARGTGAGGRNRFFEIPVVEPARKLAGLCYCLISLLSLVEAGLELAR